MYMEADLIPCLMQIKAIPFIVFDAGGVLELFNHESFSDNVIKHATSDALASKLDDVLERGTLSTVKLGKDVTNGQQKWLQFHQDFAASTDKYQQVPPKSIPVLLIRRWNILSAECHTIMPLQYLPKVAPFFSCSS